MERARRRTRELGVACRQRSWSLVLCHADLHVGNVLVDGAGRVWIVDWDGPRLSPRERDLMFVLDGGILGAHGAEEEAAFFEGYGPTKIDPLALAYFRYAWGLNDLASFAEEAGRGDEATAAWFARQFDPGAILATAFRADSQEVIL